MAGDLYHYFVEGECEKALIKAFMHVDKGSYCFKPGKVEKLNFVFEKLTPAKAMSIKKGTKVVIIFDTDVDQIDIFENNIDILIKHGDVDGRNIILVPSVINFEEEIVYSCESINNINDIFNTKGKEEFKNKFINHKDLVSKLYSVGFDINKMWSRDPKRPFDRYKNHSLLFKEKTSKE